MNFKRLTSVLIVLGCIIASPSVSYAASTSVKSKKAVVTTKTAKAVVKPKANPRKATILIMSERELHMAPGNSVSVRLGLKNTGSTTWKTRSLHVVGVDSVGFADPSWVSTSTLVLVTSTPVLVGRLEFYDFVLQAPDQPGKYTFKAGLLADGGEVEGADIIIPVTVEVSDSTGPIINTEQLPAEPLIRVALGKAIGGILVQAVGDYEIKTLDGSIAMPIPSGAKVSWQYDQAGGYIISSNGVTTSSPIAFRMQPNDMNGRIVIHDREDRPKWNGSINYDEFRGALEMRWSDKIPGLWLVNELSMEYYLKGLIETGNSEPAELQKAVYTAARSYAYVQLPDGVRYANRMWDVHAVWDQVYKGYAVEKSNPRGMQAVDDTHGQVVTYDSKPVVTPYFTRSNGRTKSWKSVWGGTDKPWLQPVEAIYDKGMTLWGHGVGMSTRDAKLHVQKDSWNYEQILKHYYTGIEIKKMYQ